VPVITLTTQPTHITIAYFRPSLAKSSALMVPLYSAVKASVTVTPTSDEELHYRLGGRLSITVIQSIIH